LIKRSSPTQMKANRARASELASTYRQLRKGSEDLGNFAAANDLFYGERLWTRKANRCFSFAWSWLAAYGLVGYGVRPWRPLAGVAVLISAAAVGFGFADGLKYNQELDGRANETAAQICERGLPPARPETTQTVTCETHLAERLEFAVRATTSLVRPINGYIVHGGGVVIEITLRLLAALMFGLFVLAMRNRVHR